MKMSDYWEEKFQGIETLWGFEPSESAIQTSIFYKKNKIKNILIPGIGYGRNAKVFIEKGIKVTGIEISKHAINIAKEKNKLDIKIHHGSVTQMPFDDEKYDGIFCYALIHLLNKNERKRFIHQCFQQLKPQGYMIFTAISKKSYMYCNGKRLSPDRYELTKGLNVFFYDLNSVANEFKRYGLVDAQEYEEPIKFMENQPPLNLVLITCKKQ